MCGITGMVSGRLTGNQPENQRVLDAMISSLRHRGPDRQSSILEQGVGLAQSRLSIIDLSAAGDQPMVSTCGRYVIVFNGEIYNADELRMNLADQGRCFDGHSDTRALLEGIAVWGVKATLQRAIGMFAFALWDRKEQRLTLARDRLGIKPLYWANFNGLFLFGSELKALRAHPGWSPEMNRDAMVAYLRHNYIPAPYTVYQGVHKLRPGHLLTVENGKEPVELAYWSMDDVITAAAGGSACGSDGEVIDQLDILLRDAVKKRMVSDVPLGAFLSGGIDSSLVVALMQSQSSQPIKTFSIAFEEGAYDESKHAAAIAAHLGTEHTELHATPTEAMSVIPKLADMYDEPFADSSQIPTHLVSALTRDHVTVALSGDGGDEVFGGYTRYLFAQSLQRRLSMLPGPLRRAAATLILGIEPRYWDTIFRIIPSSCRPRLAGDRIHKFANILTENEDGMYRSLISQWQHPESVALSGTEPWSVLQDGGAHTRIPDFTARMQYFDTLTYLPDDILTKVDRASMAVGLEARVPLLDHRVVEFAWTLPTEMKIRNGVTKWPLRQVLNRYVPRHLVERPKMGFAVPIDQWLRGPLRDWAEDLLSEAALQNAGMFNTSVVRGRWAEHLGGKRNWHYPLWTVLMAQAWYIRWKPAS